MKWPVVEEKIIGAERILKVEYLTRTTELILNRKTCTACGQCIKACPKNALAKPYIPPGKKVNREERDPILPEPLKCVFCGVCMSVCPYKAITMKLDNKVLSSEDLQLSKAKIIPSIVTVKVGSIEIKEKDFTNDFWNKIVDRITIKRPVPAPSPAVQPK